MESFYIHIHDPGFPNEPWPNVRRLGPFNTIEEAQAQAASDAATGAGLALGIYSADLSDSTKHSTDPAEVTPTVLAATIQSDADLIVNETVMRQLAEQAENRAALAQVLPAGVTVEDIEALKADIEALKAGRAV